MISAASTKTVGSIEAVSERPRYQAKVLRSPIQIEQLANEAGKLLARSQTIAQPSFYLASLTSAWRPCVVVVKQEEELVGIAYLRERTILGYSTGMFHLDTTLGGGWVSEPYCQSEVFAASLKVLLENVRVRALRLIIPPEGPEIRAALQLFPSVEFEVTPVQVQMQHRTLPLSSSYETFLNLLGKRTRRNFRYYRRRFEEEGHSFVDKLSLSDFRRASSELLQKDVVGTDSVDLGRASQMIKKAKQPLLVGLQKNDHRWLSILGGWYDGQCAYVFTQINNDSEHPQYSLSSVLRSYLCEKLIEEGVTQLIFWGGLVGSLHRYSRLVPGICLYIDRTHLGWRVFRRILRLVSGAFPKRMLTMIQWIVPIQIPSQDTSEEQI